MKMNKVKVSAVVIAKNESKNIEACLDSLSFVDEIVVIDTQSTDNTVELAKKAGANVYTSSQKHFSDWRNLGTQKAAGELVLHLDADERATPEFAKEVKEKINEDFGAYAIPRRNFILGKEMHYGGQWPDYVVHLVRKDNFVKWAGDLHEEPKFNGKLGYIKSPIIHLKHDNLSDMVTKTNKWSEIEAKLMLAANHPQMTVIRFVSAMLREFWLRMVRQLAFLDGPKGVIYALYQVFSRFVSYAKLWEMQISQK